MPIPNKNIIFSYVVLIQLNVIVISTNTTTSSSSNVRDYMVSHGSGELTKPRTKSDNQEMNDTIKKKIIDTPDNHNNIIRLLPRRTRCESVNIEVTRFYGEEDYEKDIIGECVFEGFVCSINNSKEFVDRMNSDLL